MHEAIANLESIANTLHDNSSLHDRIAIAVAGGIVSREDFAGIPCLPPPFLLIKLFLK